MSQPLTWIVGAGGLLGSAITRAMRDRGEVWTSPPIPWLTASAQDEIRRHATEFSSLATSGAWQIAWCAGVGVTANTAESLRSEVNALGALLDQLSALNPGFRDKGSLFLASSAGALYAGAGEAPFTELDHIRPVAPYGETKLLLEQMASRWSEDAGVPVLIGRISNIYGPGQNMSKPQGLISQVCRAHLLRQPISIYVSLDTIRDYLYIDDCAELILASMARARAETERSGIGCHTKILASQRPVTIGAVIGELRRVFKQQPKIIYSRSPLTALQARDLRMRSVMWPDLDQRPLTPLPVGIRTTINALSRSMQIGALTRVQG